MQLPAIVVNPKARALLACLLFLVAWLSGNGALIGGMEMEQGWFSGCLFAVACGFWWAGYRISRPTHDKAMAFGLGVLGLWMLSLIFALVARFRESVVEPFFWFATAMIVLLVIAIVRTGPSFLGPQKPQALD